MRTRIALCATASALAALTIAPASASAGAYTVRSCFPDGINRSWTPQKNGTFASAWTECPEGVNGNHGLYARNTFSSTPAPGFSNAMMRINAPSGTYIDAITFDGFMHREQGWHAGIFDLQNSRWLWCGNTCGSSWIWYRYPLSGFHTNSLAMFIICGAASCPSFSRLVGSMAMRNVTVRLQDYVAPSVAVVGGSLASGGWKRGVQTVDVAGSDNTGVRSVRALVDGALHHERWQVCDDHLLVPCPRAVRSSLIVDTTKARDGIHALQVVARDSAGNPTSRQQQLRVDNRAPAPVQELTSSVAAWQARNSFSVSWQNPPNDFAPIAGARYQLCAVTQAAPSCGPVHVVIRPALTSISGIEVPSPGTWKARLWLIDAAGNQDDQTAREVVLRWDPEPPAVRLLPRDEDDPARIRVAASDTVSGISSAEIELRRQGEPTWHSLLAERTSTGFSAVVDDELFPPGIYDVRARAIDAAGNERSTGATASSISLPVRLPTSLAVGRPRRVRAGSKRNKRVLIAKPRARFGKPIRLSGSLTSPGGNPLVERDIAISQQLELPDAAWEPVATVRTGSTGHFRFKAPAGPSRQLRFRYPGTPTIQGRTSFVELRIRAASSMHVNRKRVVNGEEVVFHGRVLSQPIPKTGKLLQLQVLARGQWLTFATPHADIRGRWRHDYRFTTTRGLTRYRFRIRLPRESGFPFESGVSRTVRVLVRGL